MSISANAIGELPVSGESAPSASTTKTPVKRVVTAKADVVQQPEPR